MTDSQEQPPQDDGLTLLKTAVDALLDDLRRGVGDRDRRRQVEEWLRSLSEKHPEFDILEGLRGYYLAEAGRLRAEFDGLTDLAERLASGKMIETHLEKASEMARRLRDQRGATE